MTTKPAFPALGAPMSPAWVHGSPHVEDSALPKSVENSYLSVNKAVIRWMSINITITNLTTPPITQIIISDNGIGLTNDRFQIGNTFHIRHKETTQEILGKPEQIDYL
jgi:hypothetical protein